jgi:anti-anti-sigma factor
MAVPLWPILEVAIRHLGDHTRVMLRGELDLSGELLLQQGLAELSSAEERPLVLDLGDLQFIDCRGVSLVLGARSALEAIGCRAELHLGSGVANRLFALLGLPGTPLTESPPERLFG